MANLNLTAQLLAGADVDEAALEAEIAAADMQGESFFSPAHEQAEGMQLLEAVETQIVGDAQIGQEVAERARALLGRAEELAQNTEERELLVARLKHRMTADGLPEPTDEELGRLAKLMRVVHGVEVDVHQPKWEPPRAVLDVDPNALHTADTGPVIGPAAVPPPHVQRRLARKMRDRDRDHDRDRSDASTREETQRAHRAQKAQGTRGGATSGGSGAGASGGSSTPHTGAGTGTASTGGAPPPVSRQVDPSAATSTSTGTGSGGGGGPNTATATVHIHLDHVTWPTPPVSSVSVTSPSTQTAPGGSSAPVTVPIPTPPALPAASVDLQALLQFVEGVQTRSGEETHRAVASMREHGKETIERVLAAQMAQTDAFKRVAEEQTAEMERLRQSAEAAHARLTTLKGWFLNTGFGQALIAIIVVCSIMGLAWWWAMKSTDHGSASPSTVQRTPHVDGR